MPQLQLFWYPFASLRSREASGSVPLMLLCLVAIKNLCIFKQKVYWPGAGKAAIWVNWPLTPVWLWTNHLLLDLSHRDVVGLDEKMNVNRHWKIQSVKQI